MVLNVHRNRKAYYGRGKGGGETVGVGVGGDYADGGCGGRLHCHHQNDSCIKMGSDESHFNVSLIVRDKVARQVSANHNF